MNDPFLCAFAKVDSIDDEAAKLLASEVESFVRAGGVLDAETWGKLSAYTRGAFLVARQKLDDERAKVVGQEVLAALRAYYGGKP